MTEADRQAALAAMRAEHLKFARLLQQKALEALRVADPKSFTPADIIRLLELGVTLGGTPPTAEGVPAGQESPSAGTP